MSRQYIIFPRCASICTHFSLHIINTTRHTISVISKLSSRTLKESEARNMDVDAVLTLSLVSTTFHHVVMEIIANPFWMSSSASETPFFYFGSSNKHKPVKVSLENKGPLLSFGPPHFISPSKPNSNTINILKPPLSHNSIKNSKSFHQK